MRTSPKSRALSVAPGSADWLTQPGQAKTADIASLRRALLTSDGAGREVKEAALVEIVARLLNAEASGPDFGPFFMDIDREEARRQLGLSPNDHWSATPSWRLEIRNGPRRGVAL